jgi:cation diffusion facilitator CzcD-associated flavoprotein CzcO
MTINSCSAQDTLLDPPAAGQFNTTNGTGDPKPLNIAIVGAGIGGLAAAIGLRRAGHNVSVKCLHLYTFNIPMLTMYSSMSNLSSLPKWVLQFTLLPMPMGSSDVMVLWRKTLER